MALSHTQNTVRFGQFELDLRTQQLTKNGAKIRLSQQPIQVLSLLLEAPGEIVTREEFRRRLWSSDVFVDFDHGLNKSIQKLRDALGDSAGSPRYIETIPRIGYRFIALANEARGSVELPSETGVFEPPTAPALPPGGRIARNRRARWILLAASAAACVVLAFGGMVLYRLRHRQPAAVHAANRFHRLGGGAGAFAGWAYGGIYPRRRWFSHVRPNLRQDASERRGQTGDGRRTAEIRAGILAGWGGDCVHGIGDFRVFHLRGISFGRRASSFDEERRGTGVAGPAASAFFDDSTWGRNPSGCSNGNADALGPARDLFPRTRARYGPLLVFRLRIGTGHWWWR